MSQKMDNCGHRIIQILPSLIEHDAIGHHALGMDQVLRERDFETMIYAEHVADVYKQRCHSVDTYVHHQRSGDIIIYHHSIGSRLARLLAELRYPIVINYHNITPPKYFRKCKPVEEACREGVQQLHLLRLLSQRVWADSKFNGSELQRFGFSKPDVFPIIRDYQALSLAPGDPVCEELFEDGRPNILFVGRMAPNKALHDQLLFLRLFIDQGLSEKRPRLVLIGKSMAIYLEEMRALAVELNLVMVESLQPAAVASADVVYLGEVSEGQLASLYRQARGFICLSDHEGFCVPLVEAMFCGVPILAHSAAAVPETLGDGGTLFNKWQPQSGLKWLDRIINQDEFFQQQRQRAVQGSKNYQLPRLYEIFYQVFTETLIDLRKQAMNIPRKTLLGEMIVGL